jgi:hypothetical protein
MGLSKKSRTKGDAENLVFLYMRAGMLVKNKKTSSLMS